MSQRSSRNRDYENMHETLKASWRCVFANIFWCTNWNHIWKETVFLTFPKTTRLCFSRYKTRTQHDFVVDSPCSFFFPRSFDHPFRRIIMDVSNIFSVVPSLFTGRSHHHGWQSTILVPVSVGERQVWEKIDELFFPRGKILLRIMNRNHT